MSELVRRRSLLSGSGNYEVSISGNGGGSGISPPYGYAKLYKNKVELSSYPSTIYCRDGDYLTLEINYGYALNQGNAIINLNGTQLYYTTGGSAGLEVYNSGKDTTFYDGSSFPSSLYGSCYGNFPIRGNSSFNISVTITDNVISVVGTVILNGPPILFTFPLRGNQQQNYCPMSTNYVIPRIDGNVLENATKYWLPSGETLDCYLVNQWPDSAMGGLSYPSGGIYTTPASTTTTYSYALQDNKLYIVNYAQDIANTKVVSKVSTTYYSGHLYFRSITGN